MTIWCPKCATEITHDPKDVPRCKHCVVVVDKIYNCHCGRPEEFRATDDVPPDCHYCGRCADALVAEVRKHLVPVVARSTPTTGPLETSMKAHIHLVVTRPDGRRSDIKISGEPVTEDMLGAAEDLVETLTTGERPLPEGLYEACALAFDTTREDAKERLIGAIYGTHGKPIS